MNPDLPFTQSFFTFFNNPEPEDLLRKDQQELTELINKSLYEQVRGQVKYYTQSSNRLSQLKDDSNYILIQVQLETIKNKLKNFYSMQGTGSAAMLE
ncbi:hypothetical protein [Rickettsiella massiliensis]|uniref:hypothetical protein n=1 Tax=Rickettsiella massiliensis TaxID=676517 RepID=UPI00029B1FBB|nr:hypothetical protein [Rickettsiella massiliensis]